MGPPTKIAQTTSKSSPPTNSIWRSSSKSDRMRSLAITKENLDNQRNAVQEERRLGIDNQPYGKSGELQQEMLYDNFAYKHSVIGSMEDLNAATVEDVSELLQNVLRTQTTRCWSWSVTLRLPKPSQRFAPTSKHSASTDPPAVDMTEPHTESRTSRHC